MFMFRKNWRFWGWVYVGYCTSITGIQIADEQLKDIVLNAPLRDAITFISMYITKREFAGIHASLIKAETAFSKTLHLAPRGFGKSTVGDVDYCITRILRDPNIRIMIGSKTQGQAEAFLKEIRTHFESNDDLSRVFGQQKGTKWTDKEFTVASRTIIKKEATVTALGASGAVVSKHFDLIIGDDLVGFENARTQTQREKLRDWFYSALYPTLEPHGEIHILGTRYHPLDLYQNLIDSGNYRIQIQRAIKRNGESLWEKKFSIKLLEKIKRESGLIIFGMQYQNDVELAKGTIFKSQYFKYHQGHYLEKGQWYVTVTDDQGRNRHIPVNIYMGCDLAIKTKEVNDYFVLCVIGVDENRNIYVLEIFKDRISFKNQKETIKNFASKYRSVIRIGVETVSYQEALAQELRDETTLPIKDIDTIKDKVTRAIRRSPLFENGKVYLGENMHELEENLLLFPDVEHDDLFDALEFAITMVEDGHVNLLDFLGQRLDELQREKEKEDGGIEKWLIQREQV